jgi:hypothetical protein
MSGPIISRVATDEYRDGWDRTFADRRIWLNPEDAHGYGDDNFWPWAKRTFPGAEWGVPGQIGPRDIVLHYSTMGVPRHPQQTISLLWELYPEMRERLDSAAFEARIHLIEQSCAARWRTIPTPASARHYLHLDGPLPIHPLCVDTDLFRPMNKGAMRLKHGFPIDATIGFWSGTDHAMKGYDRLLNYAAAHPSVRWIVASKNDAHVLIPGEFNVCHVAQPYLAELMNCADFILSVSRLRPFYMCEWEAFSCDLPMIDISGEREFVPSAHPRDDVFARGWDRATGRDRWLDYIAECASSI